MNSLKNAVLPDWLGSGQDLFGTIQIITGKQVKKGFLEIDFNFKFSETFNYPIVFQIKSSNSYIEAYAISFRIDKEIDSAQRAIEEDIIAPEVCSALRHNDFIKFFADVVEKNVDFALYLNKIPRKFRDIKSYLLNDQQKFLLNERFILAITDELDLRHR